MVAVRCGCRLLAVVVAIGVTGCADDSGVPVLGDDLDAGEIAAVTAGCDALRDSTNERTSTANEVVAGIHGRNPTERFEALFDGYDDVAAVVAAWDDRRAVAPPFAGLPEAPGLGRQLDGGVAAALAELNDEQRRFAAAYASGEIADEAVQGAVGEFFNSVEKVNSSLRVRPGELTRPAVAEAFASSASCDHVSERRAR